MTVLLKARQTTPPARLFAMAATILAITALQPSLAQSQAQAHPEIAAKPEPGVLLATDGLARTGHDFSSRAHETAIGDSDLSENSYDFTDPDRIPGFASKPYNDPLDLLNLLDGDLLE